LQPGHAYFSVAGNAPTNFTAALSDNQPSNILSEWAERGCNLSMEQVGGMTKSDKVLVVLLRFLGVTGLLALFTVFMPVSWMAATHRWLGLGEMPIGPVVEYMARSLSALSILLGALCLLLTSDLERYRPLVRFLGAAFALMSPVAFGIDLTAGMPWWWSAFDLTAGVVIGVWLIFLARPVRRA
jgi:hypothetical protein